MDEDEILSYGLDFVNEALSDLGQTDLLTGLSKTADDPRERRCAISYAKTRLMVLSQVEWNFARTLMACASTQTGAIGNTEYPFVTPLPGDCVRLLGAFTRDGEEPIREVYDDMIHSAEPLVTLSYIRDVEDPHDWSERARGLLVLALAAAYAKIIKGSSSELQIREQLYQNALQEAILENAKENKRPKQHVGGNFYGDVLRGIATASNDKDRAREIMVPMQGTSRIYQALTQEMNERKLADATITADLETETLQRIEADLAEATAREKADTEEANAREQAFNEAKNYTTQSIEAIPFAAANVKGMVKLGTDISVDAGLGGMVGFTASQGLAIGMAGASKSGVVRVCTDTKYATTTTGWTAHSSGNQLVVLPPVVSGRYAHPGAVMPGAEGDVAEGNISCQTRLGTDNKLYADVAKEAINELIATAIANVFNGTTPVTLGENTYRAEASADGETLIFKKVTA